MTVEKGLEFGFHMASNTVSAIENSVPVASIKNALRAWFGQNGWGMFPASWKTGEST
ncbi:MAG: hypothetical protein KAU94_08100 [Verrucomicrobia bacterium]|nr:hypothetical protein [Verrucomicrobiota bacterium]